jgi:exodeoxyribonuclease VII large subunit
MSRFDLNVPFKEKDQAKALGARWDSIARVWYVPEGTSHEKFFRWFTERDNNDVQTQVDNQEASEVDAKGTTLSEYLQRVRSVIAEKFSGVQWVRCEIANINERNGNYYLELAESNNGQQMAKIRSTIWKTSAPEILRKFSESTGSALAKGQKVLLLVSANFHELYGFSINITDIDPAYTLGDMEAMLQRLREILQKEGIYGNNKKYLQPAEFTRVAVIAPAAAAGLGDFYSIMERLVVTGLCELDHYPATFQGEQAEQSLNKAVTSVFKNQEKDGRYDLLVIIRGGGSSMDLAWMNNELLARAICNAPLAVYTGIGHQRDKCLPDELALRSFETPSALAGHIFGMIVDNAREVQKLTDSIRLNSVLLVENANLSIMNHRNLLERNTLSIFNAVNMSMDRNYRAICNSSQLLIESTNKNTKYLKQKISLEAKHRIQSVDQSIRRTIKLILEKTKEIPILAMRQSDGHIQRIGAITDRDLNYIQQNINRYQFEILRNSKSVTSNAEDNMRAAIVDVRKLSKNLTAHAMNQTHLIFKVILAYGAESTLKRGFVLVRNDQGKVLSSRISASKEASIELEFHDGKLGLINPNVD